MKLNQTDIDFIYAQLTLPGNDPRNAPLGTVFDPTGIRDVQGMGNNIANPTWGAADQPFERLTGSVVLPTPSPTQLPLAPTPLPVGQSAPAGQVADPSTVDMFFPGVAMKAPGVDQFQTRNTNITIARTDTTSPREISNLVVDQSAEALAAVGYLTEGQQKLAVLDDPGTTQGTGRLNPFTGNVNPLPYSAFTTMLGQFFDHGLDFVKKGADGSITIELAPGDPLYNANAPTNFMKASRSNTVQVDIGVESSDALLGRLGLTEGRFADPVSVTPQTVGANGGVLMINKVAINIANNRTLQGVRDDINAQSGLTGVVATVAAGQLTLTASGESLNTISPFVDLSQSYGSQISHTVFLREYDANGQVTGRLVSGAAPEASPLATWKDIKANALNIGITLNNKDVVDIPLVRLNADGSTFLDANGEAWLIARHKVSGSVYFVQNTDIAANTVVLRTNGTQEPAGTLETVKAQLVLQTMGHAFLDDMAHTANPSRPGFDAALLDAHFVTGDGRTNENIGLTAIQEIFHVEHNRVLQDIKAMVLGGTDSHGVLHARRADADTWTGEMFFQAAKLVNEMEYQHMIFGEFARKLSPNITPFGLYDVTIDPSIKAEFAHAVYRFGHSMLNDTVGLTGFDPVTGLSTGEDKSVGLIQAFLNPKSYTGTTAGEFAIGGSQQVGNGIDIWVTDALRNNLVGLPLDLATLNIARGRDTGLLSLNGVRADLFAQTNNTALKPYDNWLDFKSKMVHEETLVNFVMAYSRDTVLTLFGTTAPEGKTGTGEGGAYTIADWDALRLSADAGDRALYASGLRAAGEAAIANGEFMTYDQGINAVDFWLGGLAEAKVPGGMLGSTFDFIFALQMVELQNADRFYYLNRLAGTNMLAEIEAQLFSDVVMRTTGVENLYKDIFSVPDATLEMASPDFKGFGSKLALQNATVSGTDVHGANQLLGTAGWVLEPVTGWTFYGNQGNYLDARGVLNANGIGNASEVIGGTAINDRINGAGGNDTVWGKSGNDTIEGGRGNDFLHGELGDDTITDEEGDDWIWGAEGNDSINAGNGIDNVFGGDGADTIFGGTGGDVLDGGAGDDVVYGDNLMGGSIGGLADADIMGGGEGNDTLYGGQGDDIIDGGEGDDKIHGGAGADLMTGGLGNDWFIMDAAHQGFGKAMDGGLGHDVADYSASNGQQLVVGGPTVGVNINLSVPGVATLVPSDALADVEGLIGTRFNDTLVGGALIVNVYQTDLGGNFVEQNGQRVLDLVASTGASVGFDIADVFGTPVIGTDPVTGDPVLVAENYHIEAGAGDDIVTGGDGHDTLDGGAGVDTLSGGLGNDVYVVDDIDDVVVEGVVTDVLGTAVIDPVTGNVTELDPTLQSIDRIDTTLGSFSLANHDFIENLKYVGTGTFNGSGNALNNVITGGAGNDTLTGGGGIDTLQGGLGNDRYNVNNTQHVIVEALDEGTDLVVSTASYTLTANLENLTLGGNNGINGTGNELSNVITGNNGANNLSGGAGNDSLVGGAGNDTLTGGDGADTLVGGTGNDVYLISDQSDTIVETAQGGTDTVQTTLNVFSLLDVANLENLTYAGLANFTGTGNASNNVITGAAGNDTLSGGGGNDSLVGGDGADRLIGGAGADTLSGGGGNDVFVIASATDSGTTNGTRDLITDFTRGADKIDVSGIIPGNFTFVGTSQFSNNATNQLRYAITGGQLVIQGSTNSDTAAEFTIALATNTALSFDDFIGAVLATPPGGGGGGGGGGGVPPVAGQTLTGSNGDNTLNGGAGNDSLNGNGGNDVLNGGDGADTVNGGTGRDDINGGLGNDVLTGGTGNDFFVFNSALGSTNVDRITDFSNSNRNNDTIRLENAVFTGLANGNLDPGAFRQGTQAGDATDRVIYNNTTGELFFDADGDGAGAQVLFAVLENRITLTAADFVVI